MYLDAACHFNLVSCILCTYVCSFFGETDFLHLWCVLSSLQADLEDEAAGLVDKGDLDGARSMLAHHTNDSAIAAVTGYHTLFDTIVARYHDGYQMQVGKDQGVKVKVRVWMCLVCERERGRERGRQGESKKCAYYARKK